jgi:quinol monooxygenase YgiN
MIIIAGSFRVPVDKQAAAQAHFEKVVKGTRAEAGNVTYAFSKDVLEPDLIRVFEIYENADAVAAHAASDHFKAWRASNPEIGLTDRDIKRYDATLITS